MNFHKICDPKEIKDLQETVFRTIVNNPINIKKIINLIKLAGILSRHGINSNKLLFEEIKNRRIHSLELAEIIDKEKL